LLQKLKPKSEFSRNVLTLMTGRIIAWIHMQKMSYKIKIMFLSINICLRGYV